MKYKEEASKYLNKTLNTLKESKPGQIFSVLKRLGSQPGDFDDSNFVLPNHESESLSAEQSANKIADHFASISQEFPPLSVDLLPERIRTKLESKERPPFISEYETYRAIQSAKKPRAGVPQDLPKAIIKEFTPELASPVSRIINNMFISKTDIVQ